MKSTQPTTVTTVADARSGLSGILRDFRATPDAAQPVVIGSHRRPEAVLVPYGRFQALSETAVSDQSRMLPLLLSRSGLIRRLASLSNIEVVAVFGSVARGTDTESSDIDLLVTPNAQASLFDLAQFEIDMSELTGRNVDVVSRRALDPDRDETILSETVEL